MRIWLAGLILTLVWSAAASAGTEFKRIVTFGDSLSDPGNAFVVTREVAVRPFEPIPDAPYLIGRLHFSNGPTWVEQLARTLRLRTSARPALRRPGLYTNYAFGAARARPVGVFDLATQVDLFLDDFDQAVSSDALYALFIGSNDLRDAFAAFVVDPDQSEEIVTAAIEATFAAIQRLSYAGARSFLVLNIPNIANTPQVRDLGLEAQLLARALAAAYNTALAEALTGLAVLNPEITITSVDVFDALNAVVEHSHDYGLANVTDSCITPHVIRGAICRRPDRYLFWDFIHPTRKGHQLLSEEVQAALEGASAPAMAGLLDETNSR